MTGQKLIKSGGGWGGGGGDVVSCGNYKARKDTQFGGPQCCRKSFRKETLETGQDMTCSMGRMGKWK